MISRSEPQWLTIPGDPGEARANARLRPVLRKGVAQLVTRGRHRTWQGLAAAMLRNQWKRMPLDGAVYVDVHVYWPKTHRQGPAEGLAFGDVDAVAKSVLDALEAAGVVHNDAQIEAVTLMKRIDRENPRIEVLARAAH